jgi:hypothetical protein
VAFKESVYKQDNDWSQRKYRRGQMFRDQHGRTYHAEIEIKTMDPCGLVEPQYQAPLVVPSMYLERSIDPERPYDLVINYDRWEADINEAREIWLSEGHTQSRVIYGEKYNPDEPFSLQVLSLIGPPPQHVEPVIAARQGNSWVLGLTQTPDPRLVKFFPAKRLTRTTRRANEPDFSDAGLASFAAVDPEEEARYDLEDEIDPKATGGTRVPVKTRRRKANRTDPVPATAE